MTEAARLVAKLADALGALVGVADNPDVSRHVVNRQLVVAHVGANRGGLNQAGAQVVGHLVLQVVTAQHRIGALSRLLTSLCRKKSLRMRNNE